uniref:protein LEKR1 isoform X4 n=1 Tax=Scatophagus argus TaxID=75038 RepID=UPI001ED847D1|nr:protein LEKR1 isoform X4 [Scatophagus argus]
MGDKERCMEVEQEGEKEMKTLLHCPPIYPLPEEINKMDRSETVCCYCGVSYLIFHEFHQLSTRLAQLESELQRLRETAQREKAQREALELGRLEWERALYLDVQQRAEEKEKSTRKELEDRNKDMERTLREEFEQKNERKRKEMTEEYQKISEEKQRQLRRQLGDLEAERLRKQREELESRIEEREKVLSDALQKANKNLDGLRKYLQQLEERLAIAASMKEEGERLLGSEKQQSEILRGVCVRQQQALRETLSVLRSSGSELTHVRGFLSQLTGAWQVFRCQILQHSTQVFSVMREELKNSTVGFQKMKEEKEHLMQQLMEMLIESHGKALTKMEEYGRQQMSSKLASALEEQRTQNALHLREQMEELRRETDLELTIEREKNQLLLLQYQRDSTKLQQKLREREQELQGLQDELLEERRMREEEVHQEQQEALQLSQAKAELQLMTERNAHLQEEVVLLQETVRRECEEREGLTAALAQAQEELHGLQSSHGGSSRSPLNPMERHTHQGNKHLHLHSQSWVHLARSSNSPNRLHPSSASADKDRRQVTDGGGAERRSESWNCDGMLGREKWREGALPRLKASSTVGEVKRKVNLVIERRKRL